VDLTGARWRKSSYSGNNGGQCVEVAAVPPEQAGRNYVLAVRDSKDPSGTVLTVAPEDWRAFTAGLKAGVPGLNGRRVGHFP
jgi:hypothetical protein